MSYNTKNYQENGEKLVIGGTLEIEDGATVTGLPAAEISKATSSTLGGIKAATKSAGDTVEIKIDSSSAKLYAPRYPKAWYVEPCDASNPQLQEVATTLNAVITNLVEADLMSTH